MEIFLNNKHKRVNMNDSRIFTNIERFINEVSTRSCIWNKHCPDYKIKSKRKQAWEEICAVFFENYNSKSSDRKEHLCLLVQRKWKSLRDNYVRDLRKNKRLKYAHSYSLSFLDDNIKLPEHIDPKTKNNINADYNQSTNEKNKVKDENENEDDDDDVNDEDDDFEEYDEEEEIVFKKQSDLFSHENNYQSSNSNNSMFLDVQSLDEHETSPSLSSLQAKTFVANQDRTGKGGGGVGGGGGGGGLADEDEDRMFLLSLLKDLKKVPQQNKLEAKSELLLVLNKWQKLNGNNY